MVESFVFHNPDFVRVENSSVLRGFTSSEHFARLEEHSPTVLPIYMGIFWSF